MIKNPVWIDPSVQAAAIAAIFLWFMFFHVRLTQLEKKVEA